MSLKNLNNDSSPGFDGIPPAFYKCFWNKLKHVYFNSLQQAITVGELSSSQRRGIVTLLHKGKDLDRDIIKNWRPVTLTNTDYKIITKVKLHDSSH